MASFFLRFQGETKKVNQPATDWDGLMATFKDKFGEPADSALQGKVALYTEDLEYGVSHELEGVNDIHEGAVIEVRIEGGEEVDAQKELEEVKKQVSTLETQSVGSKRPRSPSPEGSRDDAAESAAVDDDEDGHFVKLRGLPWGCTEMDIRDFLDGVQLAEKDAVTLLSKQGRFAGQAVVECLNAAEKEEAMKKDRKHIGKRYIEVFSATSHDKVLRSESPPADEGSNSDGEPSSRNSSERASKHIVRIRGLPFTATEQQVREFFDKLEVVAVNFLTDPNNRPSGDAFIEFPTADVASESMEFHRKHMGHRYIEVFASNHGEMEAALNRTTQYPDDRARGGKDRSSHRGRASNTRLRFGPDGFPITAPVYDDSVCLRMQGLPFGSTEEEIAKFFEEARVTPVRIHRKPGAGDAYVEFVNDADAHHALKLDRAHMGKRYIELYAVPYREMADIVGLPQPTYSSYGRGPPPPPRGYYEQDRYERPYDDSRDYDMDRHRDTRRRTAY